MKSKPNTTCSPVARAVQLTSIHIKDFSSKTNQGSPWQCHVTMGYMGILGSIILRPEILTAHSTTTHTKPFLSSPSDIRQALELYSSTTCWVNLQNCTRAYVANIPGPKLLRLKPSSIAVMMVDSSATPNATTRTWWVVMDCSCSMAVATTRARRVVVNVTMSRTTTGAIRIVGHPFFIILLLLLGLFRHCITLHLQKFRGLIRTLVRLCDNCLCKKTKKTLT